MLTQTANRVTASLLPREGAAFADTGGYPKRGTAAHHARLGVCHTCGRPIRMTATLYTGALHGALLSRRDGFTRALYTPLTTHGARPKFSKIFRVLSHLSVLKACDTVK